MAFDTAKRSDYLTFYSSARGTRLAVDDIATVPDLNFSSSGTRVSGGTVEWHDDQMRAARGGEEPPDDTGAVGSASPRSQASGPASYGVEPEDEGLGATPSLLQLPTSTSAAALGARQSSASPADIAESVTKLVSSALAANASSATGGQGQSASGGRGASQKRGQHQNDDGDDDEAGGVPDPAPDPVLLADEPDPETDEGAGDLAEIGDGSHVGLSFQSQKHVFSIDDIIGGYNGVTYGLDEGEDPTIIDMSDGANTYTDKDGTVLYPIDSEFGFIVNDFIGAVDKTRDNDYAEGWAGNITNDDGDLLGIALHNAATDTFKSGQPLGTWAAGLGGNSVKASTEHYDVMASLLSDQAYAEDPTALYTLDNDLRIVDLEVGADENGNTTLTEGVLNGLWVKELTQALETSFAAITAGLADDGVEYHSDIDFNRDGVLDDYSVFWDYETAWDHEAGTSQEVKVAKVDIDGVGEPEIVDSWLNGYGTADVTDLLEPNESTTTYDIAVGDDYSVTLKDDGKLLYRWGTIIKRPNDIRMDIKLDLPDEWKEDGATSVNDNMGYKVTRAELVVTHDITNNPNDQIRPEDYENEDAIGRLPGYYRVIDPDDETGANELWVSPNDAYGGDSSFLPSYFKLDASGNVDLEAGGTAVYLADGVTLAGYRNEDADGNFIGTVLRDMSLVDANAQAELQFESEDLTEGYTNAWFTTMDRDPFEWSYDANDSDYIQTFVGFASREQAEAAGFTEDQLYSGPRWRLTANKFGQDIPGVVVPEEDNSQPPFQHDNIGYPVGETTVTTINLLDWENDDSPLNWSNGWTTIAPEQLDENGDGVIDDGWSMVNGTYTAGQPLPDEPILYAVSPNGQSLTAEFFDVSFYLKGDRQDSAKLYDVQLILEYETDPSVTEVYDYGDAPDDGETTFYQYGPEGAMEAARAQILAGFFLGAPVDGETVLAPDIDAEFAPLTDLYALGDDTSNADDEGNAVKFLTPLAGGELAYADVTASLAAANVETAYLFAWFDLDGSGSFDAGEIAIDGYELTDGAQLVHFEMPDYDIGNLEGGTIFARFILADTNEGVAAYREPGADDFFGEVEDYLIQLTSPYDDVVGRTAETDTWWAGLSDGDMFQDDNFGKSFGVDWSTVLVTDLNGDGIDDIAGFVDGLWAYGLTTYAFDPAAYADDPTSNYLTWQFDFDEFDGRLADPRGEIWALDMNSDGNDEVLYRDAKGRLNALSLDESFDPAGRLPKLAFTYYDDMLVGDFDGDGAEELTGLRVDNIGQTDNWRMLDYSDLSNRVRAANWRGSWQPDDYSYVVGDYNGDGMDDIAGRDSDGKWIVSLSLGRRFESGKNWITYDKGEVLGGGDANGDGLTDLVLFDAVHGQFMVGLADPDEETFSFAQFGGIPYATDWVDMKLGDFNGDGLVDVAARDAATGRWTVAESNGEAFVEDQYGTWEDDATWQNVMVGNFDATPTILAEAPVELDPEIDDGNGKGNGAGDGTGDNTDEHGGHVSTAPTPPDVLLQTEPTYRVDHTFTTADIAGGYDGATQASDGSIINFLATPTVTKDGVELYPIDSEFGFFVTDFVGAEDKTRDGIYTEGFAGDLLGEQGEQLGLLVSDARTDTLKTQNLLGTWLVGMGGSAVKASTEHYTVMQQILSDQPFPQDVAFPQEDATEDAVGALLPLDDDLWIVDYQTSANGAPVLDAETGDMIEGAMHGFYVKELVQALEQASEATNAAIDFDRDTVADAYSAEVREIDFGGYTRNVAAVDIGDDGTIDYFDAGLNGFYDPETGTGFGIADILIPNESTVLENIAVGDDYSVTLKDDGKLLYRWGNLIKRPNDVRINVTMPLPDEWQPRDADGDLETLYRVTAAELVVNHTVTNNPNDQIRPEDFENESAIGTLPGYEVVTGSDGFIEWLSTDAFYAGDGTLYEAGTVLRDMALVEELNGSLLDYIGATSSDLDGGFTNEWYTTMDREPFVAVYDDAGEYVVGPRWRLQPDKFGQDLPSVVIPQDPSDELPVRSGEEKYEVGADTTTVINLLDWNGTSPLAVSAGWMIGSGESSVNGLMMTDDFDVSVYIKGDINPVTLYNTELVMTYEEVEIHDEGSFDGTDGDDVLVGRGHNIFDGGAGEDIFILGYGTHSAAEIAAAGPNVIEDFTIGEDAVGFIGYGLNVDNYNVRITQQITDANDLVLSLDGEQVATLFYLDTMLEADSFYFA